MLWKCQSQFEFKSYTTKKLYIVVKLRAGKVSNLSEEEIFLKIRFLCLEYTSVNQFLLRGGDDMDLYLYK